LKLADRHASQLEETPAGRLEDGRVRFHIEALDLLNDRHGAREVGQLFRHPSLGNDFSDRHKAWGFHLWYRLEFDDDLDVVELVKAYESLDEVVIAEPEYLKRLLSDPAISYDQLISGEENDSRWTPDDPFFASQWHYHNTGQEGGTPGADIDLIEAWDIEKGHPAVVVAVIDDGIQFNHPDLSGNMWQNASGHYGYNFVDDNTTIIPGNHGTHVAGTVAAVSNNGTGVAGIAGGSGSGDGVRLMSCQVFAGSSTDGFHLAPVWAADNGAAISQNSWGYTSPGGYNQSELDAIDYFNLNGGGDVMNGGITIFAAGNDDDSGNWYPGYYSGALAVAATNNQDQKADYSNYGSWIDISAPGGEMITAPQGVLSTITSGAYAYAQGTSMACPHVSGVAALLLSFAHRNSIVMENSDLWDLLVNNVDDHYPENPSYTGQLGSGRLNARLALEALQGGLTSPGPEYTFTAISDRDIVAHFAATESDTYEITAEPNNPAFGEVTGGGTYEHGTPVTLNAIPNTGYHFVAWEEEGAVVSTDAEYTFTAEADWLRFLPSTPIRLSILPAIMAR